MTDDTSHPFYTFLVFVDRTDLPHLTVTTAEAYVSTALQLQAGAVDLGTDDTLKLIARGVTCQPIDLEEEAEIASRNIRIADMQARVDADLAHARRLPALLTGAKLDALVAVYAHELERRTSLVILAWWARDGLRRWWRKRQVAR